MQALRLITDSAELHYPNNNCTYLLKQLDAYVIPAPEGKMLIAGFIRHAAVDRTIPPIVKEAINKNIGVVYLCDVLPKNPIIDKHIVYVVLSWKWMIHTIFSNPLKLKGVFSCEDFKKTAQAFSEFTKFKIPLIKTVDDIKDISVVCDKSIETKSLLFEITGGVGDHLLCIPTMKTYKSRGYTINVLCQQHRKDCYDNLDIVSNFYTLRDQIDVSKFDRIYWLHFGQILNDYRLDVNKQNRVYAIAEICGFTPQHLVRHYPEIKFTQAELTYAKNNWGKYSKTILLGFDSARVDTRIDTNQTQEIINKLQSFGYTVFIPSLKPRKFDNCINLTAKLNLRQLFSLINSMDCVLTVDSSFMHIAGALEKRTFTLMNYFNPDWRCSTYKNMKVYTPNVKCFPCWGGQAIHSSKRECNKRFNSCYKYFDWDIIYKDINNV